jgi:hypothetical protein
MHQLGIEEISVWPYKVASLVPTPGPHGSPGPGPRGSPGSSQTPNYALFFTCPGVHARLGVGQIISLAPWVASLVQLHQTLFFTCPAVCKSQGWVLDNHQPGPPQVASLVQLRQTHCFLLAQPSVRRKVGCWINHQPGPPQVASLVQSTKHTVFYLPSRL